MGAEWKKKAIDAETLCREWQKKHDKIAAESKEKIEELNQRLVEVIIQQEKG